MTSKAKQLCHHSSAEMQMHKKLLMKHNWQDTSGPKEHLLILLLLLFIVFIQLLCLFTQGGWLNIKSSCWSTSWYN